MPSFSSAEKTKRAVRAFVLVSLFVLPVVAVTPTFAKSSTYYVAPTGSGGGSCSTPDFDTIQSAVNSVPSGSKITVCAGTYDEVVAIGQSVNLQGEEGAIIKPDSNTALLDQGMRRVAIYITADYVTVQGITIDGTSAPVNYGVYAFNANYVTVAHNTIFGMQNDAYDVAGVGILFYGWGQPMNYETVTTNTVYNTARMGIFIGGVDSAYPYNWLLSTNDLVDGNTVYNAWQGPTADYGGAIQVLGAQYTDISGNNVFQTGYSTSNSYFTSGVYLLGSGPGNTITKNNSHMNYVGIMTWTNPSFVEFGSATPTAPTLSDNNLHQNTQNLAQF